MENEIYRKENFIREGPDNESRLNSINDRKTENYSSQSLLSPRELLRKSWFLYKARFRTLLGLSIIKPIGSLLILIMTPILYVLFLYLMPLLNLEKPVEASIINIANWIFVIIMIISFIVVIWFIVWNQVALIYVIKDSRENIGIKESFKRARHKAKRALIVSLLAGFITIAGYFLFFIPGLIFSVWFTFAMFVVVEEDLKGMNVLLKCREYIRGYWWKVLWRSLYIGGIIVGIEIFFAVFEYIFLFFNLQIFGELVNLVDGIVVIVLAPLIIIYQFLLYKNIKAIKGDFVFAPSRGQKIKFIIIGIIGSILGILMAISMLVLINNFGDNLDKESKAYIDMTVPIIVNSWDPQELISRASPAFLENNSSDKIKLSFNAFSARFGLLKEYKGSEGEAEIKFGEDIIATYEIQAIFENGSAIIQIQIIKIDDNWQIIAFQLWPLSGSDDLDWKTINIEKSNQYYADINEVKNLWSGGSYQQALNKANEVLPDAQTDEEKAWAHYWIGLNQYKLLNYVIAESELQIAIELDENYAAPYVTLAAIEMDGKGNYSKALEYSEECISLDPEYAWCYNSNGLALLFLGREAEGIKALEQAVSLSPDSYVFRDNLTRAEQMISQNKAEENNISINQNDEKRKTDLATISILLYEYKNINGQFPISPSMTKLNQNNNEVVNEIKSISSSSTIPIDYKLGNYYGYISSDGKNFELTAKLENVNDSDCSSDVINSCIYKLKSDS